VREFEDTGGQKSAKGTRERSHHDIKRKSEGQFATPVPAGEVVCYAGHHSCLEHAKEEADSGGRMDIVHECCADGANAESEGDTRDEPAGAHDLADHVGWNFEDDVGDVEYGKNPVVIISA
jgi:hypothetical protein